jgi:hypothetical protein
MDPGINRRSSRRDAAVTWWASLYGHVSAPARPARALAAWLVAAAIVAAAAMPLVWHRLTLPNPAFFGPPVVEVLDGVDADSWLIAVALVAICLAIRAYRQAPGPGTKVVIAVLAAATVNGMFVDYIDWSRRGVSLQVQPFYGPGFFVGLGCGALLVVAAIVGWRARE